MPRQVGPVFLEGTFGDLIFYKLNGIYYVRQKPAKKKRKQMEADERYERTLQKADQFGLASDISKWVYYRYVVKAVRRHGLFGELTGMANRRLQAGQDEEEVKAWLIGYCQGLGASPTRTTPLTGTTTTNTEPITALAAADTVSSKKKPVLSHVAPNHKQPRYLSRWKVNRKGRLQVPKQARAVLALPTVEATTDGHQTDG